MFLTDKHDNTTAAAAESATQPPSVGTATNIIDMS